MIYFIEGCTCAGKSTLVKQILSGEKKLGDYNVSDWIHAPKHTPEPMNDNTSIVDRQFYVFTSFVSQFLAMIATGKNYLADFSPWGVIPFSLAYLKLVKGEERQRLLEQTERQNDFLIDLTKMYDEQLKCISYLKADAAVIKERLKNRRRAGDDFWTDEFIENVVKEYNNMFSHFVN